MPMANGLEKLSFERSGGMFPLTLGGEVLFTGAAPGVVSEAQQGPRPLTPQEQAMFAALDPAKLRGLPSPLTQPVPDGYQWDVTLSFNSGPVSLRWYAPSTPPASLDTAAPGLGALASWVQREVDRIWAHRTGAPRP